MILAWPAALLLLLGAIPVVLAFLRRPPPRAMVVSSLLLMEALGAAPEHRRLPPPRELLAMALLLLALVGLTAAVALRPDPPPPGRLVLLDTSASMATRVDGQTRLDAARTALAGALQATGDGPVTLVTTAPPRILVRDAQSPAPILAAAAAITPAGEDGGVRALLAALCAADAPLLIALTEELDLGEPGCTLHRPALPDAPGNRGITGLTLRAAGAVSLLEAHLEVAAREPVEVVITADGLAPSTLTLTPKDGLASRILRLSLPAGGTLTAALVGEDPFPDDDTVTVQIPAQEPLRVRLVTDRPEGFLARALRAHPGVSLEVVGAGTPAAPVDLLVLEADAPVEGARRILALHGGLSSVPVTTDGPLDAPALQPADPTAALTRYLDPTGIQVKTAWRLGLDDGAEALLTTPEGPVGVLLSGGEVIALGLSLSDSDLALRLDFAHLIANVVEWARPPAAALPQPVGVLSLAQSTAKAAAAIPPPAGPPQRDHRLVVVLVGMLLLAEWGLQAGPR